MNARSQTKSIIRVPAVGIVVALLACVASRVFHDSRHHAEREISPYPGTGAQPPGLQAQLDLGDHLAMEGRVQDAARVFADAARAAPRDAQPYTRLGALAVQDHRPDYARANFLRSAQLNPSDPEVWHALGDLYARARLNHHAIEAYQHTIRLQPDDETAWRQLGVLETEAKHLGRGYDALKRAAILKPSDLAAQIDLGNCCLISGHLPEARQAFDFVLARKPDDPSALVGAAETGLQLDPSADGLRRAEDQSDRALTLSPNAHTHLVLGRIALMRKEYARAVNELSASLAVKSDDLAAYGYLSQAYAGMGRIDLARKASADYLRAEAQARTVPVRSDHGAGKE